MSIPTRYELSYNFTDFQSSFPTTPLPADKVDIQFNNLELTTDEIIDNLTLIQRADGLLNNGIVSFDSLSNTVKALLGTDIVPRGNWMTATAYAVLDLINESGASYICAVAHTSGTFATDLASGKWVVWSASPSGSVTVNDTNWSGSDLSVVNGGTGASAFNAYGVVCGGTSTTNPLVSVAPPVQTSYILMSNGSNALPSWKNISVHLLDEDDMVSDSATKAPTQQSVKAYVDALVPTDIGVKLVASGTFSAVAQLDFTSIGTYKNYTLLINNLIAAVTSEDLLMFLSTNNGSSFITTAGYYNYSRIYVNSTATVAGESGADNRFYLTKGALISSTIPTSIEVEIRNMNTAAAQASCRSYENITQVTSVVQGNTGVNTGNYNAFRIAALGGDAISGTYKLYGWN